MLSSMMKSPEFEWDRLTEVLGLDLLSRLLGISSSGIRRYRASARFTPDEVAAQLHLLSLSPATWEEPTTKRAFANGLIENALNWEAARLRNY
jgi:hypothetical protein